MPGPNSAPELDVARRQLLSASIGGRPGIHAALFELTDGADRAYRPVTLSEELRPRGGHSFLPANSLLARWLRVNNTCIAVPDTIGVFEELTPSEKETLTSLGVGACLPLVHDDLLVAWIAFVGGREPSLVLEHSKTMLSHAHTWAVRLLAAQTAWLATERAESVSRSNRLSVTGQMAASIAHEVRNPLAAIRSTVQMIRDQDAPPGDHARLLGTVIDEVDRVNEVLTRMLTLGRPHATTQEICDLRGVSESAWQFCFAYARRRGQQIVLSHADPVWVTGDPHELRQVLVNVLLNACQASRDGAEVLVQTVTETDGAGTSWATIHVADQGVGIPPEDLPRVFEAFYTTRLDGGGLGLAICRDVVERHSGRIDLTSEMGVGTRVTIRLPWTDPHGAHTRR